MLTPVLLMVTMLHNSSGQDQDLLVLGYDDGRPYEFEVAPVPATDMNGKQVLLDPEAAEAFSEMMVEAAKKGYFLKVNLGFRTMKEQRYWYRRYNYLCKRDRRRGVEHPFYCGLAARPGYSTHQQGLSVDIAGCVKTITFNDVNRNRNPARYKKKLERRVKSGSCLATEKGYRCKTILFWWLFKNGPDFGFTNPVEEEPWHWTFTGKQEEIGVGG